MNDPNITMEEYIQLMADKAQGRDQTFNWETATYDNVYCDDSDLFIDFETDFPAIVYNDVSTSNENVSSKPNVRIYNAIKSDIDFHISFSDSKDEDYTFIYNKDSSSYKLIPANDLKPELVNDYVEINIESSYKGPTIHTTSSPKVVEREPEVTKDTMPPTNNGSTKDIQPLVVPVDHHESISEPINAPVSASRPNQKASIPFPS
ncbi:hypothetical protein Tco_0637780, partial [Tanacetum coccineum]